MAKRRNPLAKVSHNFDHDILIRRLYDDLVELEALSVTADECVTMLPPNPPGRDKRTLTKLYTLVGRLASRAYDALERGEELVALRATQLVARIPKKASGRRAR
jgi:hypothetical protein